MSKSMTKAQAISRNMAAKAIREARKTDNAERSIECLRDFVDGIDEIVKPSAKGVGLQACKGALHFHLTLISEALNKV